MSRIKKVILIAVVSCLAATGIHFALEKIKIG